MYTKGISVTWLSTGSIKTITVYSAILLSLHSVRCMYFMPSTTSSGCRAVVVPVSVRIKFSINFNFIVTLIFRNSLIYYTIFIFSPHSVSFHPYILHFQCLFGNFSEFSYFYNFFLVFYAMLYALYNGFQLPA